MTERGGLRLSEPAGLNRVPSLIYLRKAPAPEASSRRRVDSHQAKWKKMCAFSFLDDEDPSYSHPVAVDAARDRSCVHRRQSPNIRRVNDGSCALCRTSHILAGIRRRLNNVRTCSHITSLLCVTD